MSDSSERGAVILCGGTSVRMGTDKALLPFGPDEVLLQRVVRLVGDSVPAERIVCVAAVEQSLPTLPVEVRIVRDRRPHGGPLEGLAAGLTALQGEATAAFVCGCDTPLLVPGVVRRLFELLGDDQIAVPSDGDHRYPLLAIYRTAVLPTAEALLAKGQDHSLHALLAHCHTRHISVDALRDFDPNLTSLVHCNTMEQYYSALDIHQRGH